MIGDDRVLQMVERFVIVYLTREASIMNSMSQQILDHARTLPEGEILSSESFLHLGEQSAVDREILRLVDLKKMFQIYDEMFVLLYKGKFAAIRGPSINKMILGISRVTGERIAISGATAANYLGLSKHVPMCYSFWTSGEDRTMYLGAQKISFRHAPDWKLCAPSSKVGDVVRALSYLGESETDKVLDNLKLLITEQEQSELFDLDIDIPTWMTEKLSAFAAPSPAL